MRENMTSGPYRTQWSTRRGLKWATLPIGFASGKASEDDFATVDGVADLGWGAVPLPWERQLTGRIDHHVVSSRALVGNPLGDPRDRPLGGVVPPGYDVDSARSYPSVYVLQGYAGHLSMWANRSAFRLSFTE